MCDRGIWVTGPLKSQRVKTTNNSGFYMRCVMIFFSESLLAFVYICFLDAKVILTSERCYLNVALICIILMAKNADHFSNIQWPSAHFLLWTVYTFSDLMTFIMFNFWVIPGSSYLLPVSMKGWKNFFPIFIVSFNV